MPANPITSIGNLNACITRPNTCENSVIATIEEKRAYLAEWKQYTFARGEKELPARLLDIINKNRDFPYTSFRGGTNVFQYANLWFKDLIYYRGNVNTTSDWVFVTNGGNYYKHGATKCVWHTRTYINRELHPYSDDMAPEGLGLDNLFMACVYRSGDPLTSKILDAIGVNSVGLSWFKKHEYITR